MLLGNKTKTKRKTSVMLSKLSLRLTRDTWDLSWHTYSLLVSHPYVLDSSCLCRDCHLSDRNTDNAEHILDILERKR